MMCYDYSFLISVGLLFLLFYNEAAVVAFHQSAIVNTIRSISIRSKDDDGLALRTDGRIGSTWLYGKKKKGGGGRPYGSSSSQQQPPQEKQSVKDARFDSMTRQFMYTILNLNKVLPDKSKTLLKNINLCFYPGAKIGVVGLNGSGKSTLLRIMAGLDTEFDGVARPLPGARIGYLPQEPTLQYSTVQQCVDAAVQSSRSMLQKYDDLSLKLADPTLDEQEMTTLMNHLASLSDEIEAKNLWDLDRIVDRAMDALRLPPGDANTQVLSGGERRRVSLCQLLLGNYDMLLLDEPTNHLDTESIAWLEQFLDQYKGTVVAITHDRYFLENVAKWILELDRGEGIPFEGNYSDWLEEKRKRLEAENKLQTAASRAVEAELEWVRSNPKGKSTKSKARLKRYEELLAAAAPPELRTSGQIYIPPGPRLGDVVIDVSGVRKAFGDKLLIDGLEFSLPPAGIVGIIGPNGAGKSTLMNMLMGLDNPDAGTIEVGSTVKLVGVKQDRMEELNPQNTVFEEITGGLDEIELGTQMVASRAYVSWFGFKSAQQQAIVGNLSGGERNRVQLAKLLKTGANLIILGE
jgi:sulfate-transporting ATPase